MKVHMKCKGFAFGETWDVAGLVFYFVNITLVFNLYHAFQSGSYSHYFFAGLMVSGS